MKKHLSKKRVVLAAIVAVALALASGVAYAYWTGTGGGFGTASAATPSSTTGITVVQTSTPVDMYPGDSEQTLYGTLTNGTTASIYVNHVVITGLTVTPKPLETCGADDFKTGGTALVNTQVLAGSTSVTWSGLTIQFNNKGTNQDGCKGAAVQINYSTTES